MVQDVVLQSYPRQRLKGMPPSPFQHLQDGFNRLFGPRAAQYREIFQRATELTRGYMSTKIIGDLNGGRTYLEQRERFMGTMSKQLLKAIFLLKPGGRLEIRKVI